MAGRFSEVLTPERPGVTGGAVPPSRIESDPTPFLVRYDGRFEYRPTPEWTLAASAQGQITSSPLPAFEEFAGGSFSIGRGYDPGAVMPRIFINTLPGT